MSGLFLLLLGAGALAGMLYVERRLRTRSVAIVRQEFERADARRIELLLAVRELREAVTGKQVTETVASEPADVAAAALLDLLARLRDMDDATRKLAEHMQYSRQAEKAHRLAKAEEQRSKYEPQSTRITGYRAHRLRTRPGLRARTMPR